MNLIKLWFIFYYFLNEIVFILSNIIFNSSEGFIVFCLNLLGTVQNFLDEQSTRLNVSFQW